MPLPPLVPALLLLCAQGPARPPAEPDLPGLTRAVARARESLRDLPALWGIDARDVEWILTDGTTHVASRREAGRDTLAPIALPAGTTIANTSVTVDGRRWAMVVLDLARAERATVRLLVHEAMHTFQPEQLPSPEATEAGEGGDLLDGAEGRTWLFLELRALGTALTTQGDARRAAARDALLFRARRDSIAHPTERERLDALDLKEGIPEYTGWRLADATDSALAERLRGADTVGVSWVRAVGYWTGPAYGFLLDQLAGSAWRDAQRQGARLPTILATVLGSTPVALDLQVRARRYGGEAIQRRERARALANARRLDSLRTRFVTGPVLRLVPGALQVSFDPNGQTPLGDAGTVMTNFRWAGADGAELRAPSGALVSPRWDWIQVPLAAAAGPSPGVPGAAGATGADSAAVAARSHAATLPVAGPLAEDRVIEGDGWRLTLKAGWRVSRVGSRVELRPPAP